MAFDPNDDDDKALVQNLIDEAVQGLKANNSRLQAEVKKAREGRQIDPAEVEKLEDRIEELQGKLTASEKQIKQASKDFEATVKQLEAETGFTHKLLAENGIVSALTAAGVSDPAFLEASKAMLLPNVKVVADGDSRKAMFGDKDVAEAVNEWAASDVGKRFVSAPANGGGGAPGGAGNGAGAKSITRAQFEAITDPAAKADAARTMTITA